MLAHLPALRSLKVPECMICEEAFQQCKLVAQMASVAHPPVTVNLEQIDIHDPSNHGKWLKYMMHVPVIHINEKLWGMHHVDPAKLLASIRSVV